MMWEVGEVIGKTRADNSLPKVLKQVRIVLWVGW